MIIEHNIINFVITNSEDCAAFASIRVSLLALRLSLLWSLGFNHWFSLLVELWGAIWFEQHIEHDWLVILVKLRLTVLV